MLLAFLINLTELFQAFCLVCLISLYKDNIHLPSGDGVRLHDCQALWKSSTERGGKQK